MDWRVIVLEHIYTSKVRSSSSWSAAVYDLSIKMQQRIAMYTQLPDLEIRYASLVITVRV
jgi:hypothetical protein